jgi:hypothetical protein
MTLIRKTRHALVLDAVLTQPFAGPELADPLLRELDELACHLP